MFGIKEAGPGGTRESVGWVALGSALGWLGAGLLVTNVSFAHHSFAMYDNEHQVKLAGTVTSFDWNNPHVYIAFAFNDGDETKGYTIECASPGILNRVGWRFNMIKPGDKISVIIAPLKTGESGGLLKQITLSDGRVLSNGGPAGKPNIN